MDCRFEDNTIAELKKYKKIIDNEDSGRIIYLVSHLDILDSVS